MREFHSNLNQTQVTRCDVAKSNTRAAHFAASTFAVYGSFLLIAAIVFGTLSFRPF